MRRHHSKPSRRLSVELLEDRTLLSVMYWISDNSGDWANSDNWADVYGIHGVPGVLDTAIIGQTTVTITGNAGIRNIWGVSGKYTSLVLGANSEFTIVEDAILANIRTSSTASLVLGANSDLNLLLGQSSIDGTVSLASGSRVVVSGSLASLLASGPMTFNYFSQVEAWWGGSIELPGLTQVTGGVIFSARGPGSLSLPNLISITGGRGSGWADGQGASFYAEQGGHIDIGGASLQTADYVDFTVKGAGSVLSLPNLNSLAGSADKWSTTTILAVSGGLVDCPALAAATGHLDFRAQGAGSVLSLPALVSLAGSTDRSWSTEVTALDGGQVECAALAAASGGLDFRAQGSGSVLSLPALVSPAGSTDGSWFIGLSAADGGRVDCALAAATGALSFRAEGAGSVLSLPAFVSFAGRTDGPSWDSSYALDGIFALDGGQVECAALAAASGSLSFRAKGADSVLSLPALVSLAGNNAYVTASDGGRVDCAALAEVTGMLSASAEGAGSVLSLPALVSLAGSAYGFVSVSASDGGRVDCAALAEATGGMSFRAAGAGSVLSLPAFVSLAGSADGFTYTGLSAGLGGLVRLGTSITTFDVYNALIDIQSQSYLQCTHLVLNDGALLQGTGEITGNVTNLSTVKPGEWWPPGGALTIRGDYVQTESGRLEIGLTGPSANTGLVVTGTATLAGSLNVSVAENLSVEDGFTPTEGDEFQVLTFASRDGDFGTWLGLNLPDGHTLSPVYDETSLTLSMTTKSGTTTTLSASPATPVYGQAVTFTATVQPVEVSAGTPTGYVHFLDAGVAIGTAPLDGSQATFTIDTLTAGDHVITAVYEGDESFESSASSPYLLQVSKASSTTTVTGDAFTYDGTTHMGGSAEVSGAGIITGSAVLSYSGDQVNAGSYTVIATYAGDLNHTASSDSATITIDKAETAISPFILTPDPSIYGQEVTIWASVDPFPLARGLASGIVTFLDGSVILKSVTLPAGATAVGYGTTKLTAGIHEITAVYSGNANFKPSMTSPLLQDVQKAPLTVTADNKDVANGDPVPLLTSTMTGFVNGDTSSVVVGSPVLSTRATATSPAGHYAIDIALASLAASNYTALLVPGTLTVHPKVLDVRVHYGSRTMSLMNLDRDLPFLNITGIDVLFSDDVGATAASLALESTTPSGRHYALGGFAYNASSHDATWTLPTALGIDRLLLFLDNSLGARVDPSIKLLGGTAWTYAVLPGDYDGNGVVNIADALAVRNQTVTFLAPGTTPSVWADLNGDGVVDLTDINLAKSRVGSRLPS